MKEYEYDKNIRVMSRDEVRAFDHWAINTLKIPGTVLMENAGRSCAELICDQLAEIEKPTVCIFCGTGNNGGDGYVIARHLHNKGYQIRVAICGNSQKIKGDAKINLDVIRGMGLEIKEITPADEDAAKSIENFADGADFLVDAIFGTGLQGQVRDDYRRLIDALNSLDKKILAIDIPSGLDCNTGEPLGSAIVANFTVTFVARKTGFAQNPSSARYTGDVYVASIGIEPESRIGD